MKSYSLTVEEFVVILSDLDELVEAQKLILELDSDLVEDGALDITLQVATRSLIARELLDVSDEGYVYDSLFFQVIQGYIQKKETIKIIKTYKDVNQIIAGYKANQNLFVTYSFSEFILNFTVYEDGDLFVKDIAEFLDVKDRPEVITEAVEIEKDILAVMEEAEAEGNYREALLNAKVPAEHLENILSDHLNLDEVHSIITFDEANSLFKNLIVTHSSERSWMMFNEEEYLYLNSYSTKKLVEFLMKNFIVHKGEKIETFI